MAGQRVAVVVGERTPARQVVTTELGSYFFGAKAQLSRVERFAVTLDTGLAVTIDAEPKGISPPCRSSDGDRPVWEAPSLCSDGAEHELALSSLSVIVKMRWGKSR